ncbi:hypothetical protein [Arsenicibacter rosenii]|uniref:Uncharacterized protein n=1 Tax=Arsenicibacter rosenii TaxID=1750698 RepID=A0A1S2VKG6_9BACT|nr:hypothetical protein [Arsenicibacter rosenii]OIN59252.1 hypothetical protein BLX24_09690 [Arsenicibacter rosenii]
MTKPDCRQVAMIDRDEAGLLKAAGDLPIVCDVSDPDSVDRVITSTLTDGSLARNHWVNDPPVSTRG